ncbi:unnamed protein product [Vicia faba]|uniref:Dolichyl-diphosphooligosaccharide--protein glycosyltransferase subunit 1 n=1 Tax=Vicia faba TaxID=3906 RepID=A0AAV0ZTH5_VICFA|nr:unnamed protein product [Vicia faba]
MAINLAKFLILFFTISICNAVTNPSPISDSHRSAALQLFDGSSSRSMVPLPGSAKDFFNQIESLALLESKRVPVPLVLSLPATVYSLSKKDQLKVTVNTVLGSAAPPLTVKLVRAFHADAKHSAVIEGKELQYDQSSGLHVMGFPDNVDVGTYVFVFETALHDSGSENDYAIGGQIHVPIYVTGIVKVSNAEIAVLGSDLGSDETQKTLDLAGTDVVSLSANHLQKLRFSFQLITPHGHTFKPRQALLKLKHETKYEHIFVKSSELKVEKACMFWFYSEENTNTKALILSSQEASNKVDEVEEQLRNLKQELEMIRSENISLQSKNNYWEVRAKYSADRLYRFKKENEHQLFILKHENELISNAEKQARQLVTNLFQRIHCLQISVETQVAERKKQEEIIHMLQNECNKAKREFQEQNNYVERLRQKLDNVSKFPMKIAQESGEKIAITSSVMSAGESKVPAVEDFLGLVDKFYYLSGRYDFELTVGDAVMENSFLRPLGHLELDLPEAPEKAAHLPPLPSRSSFENCCEEREVKKKNGSWMSKAGRSKEPDYVPHVVAQMKASYLHYYDLTGQNCMDSSTVKEFVLFSVKLGQSDAQDSDYQPKDELAAIAVKIPKAISFINNQHHSSCHSDSHDIVHATVVLPGGVHSFPSKGGPSSLLERLSIRSFCSGEQTRSVPSIQLNPLENGMSSVAFDSSLSLLQAFAICIALVDSKMPCELSGTRKSQTEELKAFGKLEDIPTSYVSNPPVSPVGRV